MPLPPVDPSMELTSEYEATPGPASGAGDNSDLGRALPLAEVLDEESHCISGLALLPPLPAEFAADQVLAALGLRSRLLAASDLAARGLAERELAPAVQRLRELPVPLGPADVPALRELLAAEFSALLDCEDLYPPGAWASDPRIARFASTVLRPSTRQAIATGSVRERNRHVLEDAFPEFRKLADIRLAAIFRRAHANPTAALCLSGGGIRSATFALGVVQGLARRGLLRHFDYLSTVSGGGYLGGWLSAWMRRHGALQAELEIGELAADGSPVVADPSVPEAAPISHLRAFSRFLSPEFGLLSANTWALGATFLRNLLLNWLVIVPLLVAVLLLPQLVLALIRLPLPAFGVDGLSTGLPFVTFVGLATVSATVAVRFIYANWPLVGSGPHVPVARPRHQSFILFCLAPLTAAVVILVMVWAWVASGKVAGVCPQLAADGCAPLLARDWMVYLGRTGWSGSSAWLWAGLGALIHGVAWLLARPMRDWWRLPFVLFTGVVCGLVVGAVAYRLVPISAHNSLPRLMDYIWYVSLAVPAILVGLMLAAYLLVGLTSRQQTDAGLEWSARQSAWLLIVSAIWLAATGAVFLAPAAISWALQQLEQIRIPASAAKVLLALLGASSGSITLRWAFAEPRGAGPSLPVRVGRAIALPVFVTLLLIACAMLAGSVTAFADRWLPDALSHPAWAQLFQDSSCALPDGTLFGNTLIRQACGSVFSTVVALLAVTAFGFLMSRRIDTNRFSLHGMYRTRLVQAFLGASRDPQLRDPDPFTGFDDADDLAMADLIPETGPRGRQPLHIINAALNLSGGTTTAQHDRKAVAFTFSPLHSGSANLGYRPSRVYGGGVTVGTAIAISGAAASPAMGNHSSPLLSFLLTLFNVRLGAWMGNPGYAGSDSYLLPRPRSSVMPIVNEALDLTTYTNPEIYLSDGGHFENLGLYEMVRRRCHWIVVSDAGADPTGAFEDLGNALRRIRIDFGIPIEFADDASPTRILPRGDNDRGRAHETYYAIGTIRYNAVDGASAPDGVLIYIKPALYGSEPPDVLNYARRCGSFPHESTAYQFFSEEQFESYRHLGRYIIEQVGHPPIDPSASDLPLDVFVAAVKASIAWKV